MLYSSGMTTLIQFESMFRIGGAKLNFITLREIILPSFFVNYGHFGYYKSCSKICIFMIYIYIVIQN